MSVNKYIKTELLHYIYPSGIIIKNEDLNYTKIRWYISRSFDMCEYYTDIFELFPKYLHDYLIELVDENIFNLCSFELNHVCYKYKNKEIIFKKFKKEHMYLLPIIEKQLTIKLLTEN